jgi:ABC-type uncharacterized transport system ATPase subunit
MTGRENALLYGRSWMGMGRSAVVKSFDDIVDFAQLAGAIDRQVKFFSSRMQMRLGFAIAAFMNPDVLLVDEVLAVGDALFQKRCLDRMREVLLQGTTLVLVSHVLASVEAMCRQDSCLRTGCSPMTGRFVTVGQLPGISRGVLLRESQPWRPRRDSQGRGFLSRWFHAHVAQSHGDPAVAENRTARTGKALYRCQRGPVRRPSWYQPR